MFGREALNWHKWEKKWSPITSWEQFKRLLFKRFRPSVQGNQYVRLMKRQQTSTMREYRRQFEELSTGLSDVYVSVLECKFKSGLVEEIQSEMIKLNPLGLKAKMMMAQLIKDDNVLRGKNEAQSVSNASVKSGENGTASGSSDGLHESSISATRSITLSHHRTLALSTTSLT